jgi:uncharacterized protein (TIGR00251 family)
MKIESSPQTVINVKVISRSSRDQIVCLEEGMIKVKLTAPPVEGRANKALKELLARRLDLPIRDIEIISGERSKQKSLLICGLSPQDVEALLKVD